MKLGAMWLVLLLCTTPAEAAAWTCSYVEKIGDEPATTQLMRFEVSPPNVIITTAENAPPLRIVRDDARELIAAGDPLADEPNNQDDKTPVVAAWTVAINKVRGEFTPAYLFRKVGDEEAGLPTILYDEVDTLFGSKVQDTSRALLTYPEGRRKVPQQHSHQGGIAWPFIKVCSACDFRARMAIRSSRRFSRIPGAI